MTSLLQARAVTRGHKYKLFKWHTSIIRQEAQLPQRDSATRRVSKCVLCFTRYGS